MPKILCVIGGMTDDSFRPEDYPSPASFSELKFIRVEGFNPRGLPRGID